MEKITIRLNDFLFNSGILGLYRIFSYVDKEHLIQKKVNELIVEKDAFENFEDDYINTMMYSFEKDTKWYSIYSREESVRKLNFENEEDIKKLDDTYKFLKKCLESASYKAGYEIVKDEKQNPYDEIAKYKVEKDNKIKKEILVHIIEHIIENKEIYCMKDIIYTKINCFWSNVAFLNRNSNKKDIKEEYKNTFVLPVQNYLKNQQRKGDITCIECGSTISKKEASGMSWLNDVGVDINRKKSGFWNFNEDAYICPICNLVYSCVPLGFTMIGSNGIFVNQNDKIKNLISDNNANGMEKQAEEESFEKVYNRILYNMINRTEQYSNEKICEYETKNIQVVRRIGLKDNQRYEFNIIAKDKINILKRNINYLKFLTSSNFYQDVVTNIIEGRKQYSIIYEILKQEKNIGQVKNILLIQANSLEGGMRMQERRERIEEMILEGEKLQKFFFVQKENQNKLKTYIYKLQGALRANNVVEFMKIFTLFYGGLGEAMPKCKAIRVLVEDEEYFRLLGYSYIYGLQKYVESKNEEKEEEENKNEE